MARIYICDRCGKQCDPRQDDLIYALYKNGKMVDLCPKCKTNLIDWFEGPHEFKKEDAE